MFWTWSWSALKDLWHTAFWDFWSGFVSMIFDNILTVDNFEMIFVYIVCLITLIFMIRFIFSDND